MHHHGLRVFCAYCFVVVVSDGSVLAEALLWGEKGLQYRHKVVEIYSESELSGSLRRSFIIFVCISSTFLSPYPDTHILQALLELSNLGLLDYDVLLV